MKSVLILVAVFIAVANVYNTGYNDGASIEMQTIDEVRESKELRT
jgi:hypothetical protein